MNNTDDKKLKSIHNLLKLVYGIVPIVAGIDKFTNILTNWEMYLNPKLSGMLPFSAHTFMMIVGIIEIAAGIIVLIKPRLGSAIVAAWLVCIALNLLLSGHYLDVAVRDIVMAVGAFTLFNITKITEDSVSK